MVKKMRRLTQKFISWMCALTMTASLTGTAFADTEDEALQLEDPPYMEEPSAEASVAAEVSEPETPPEEETPAESEASEPETLPEEAGDDHAETAEAGEMEAGENAAAGDTEPSEPPEAALQAELPEEGVSVQSADGTETGGNTELTPSLTVGGNDVDLTNGSSGEGWSYDIEDGSLVLVNCDSGQEIIADDAGLTIKAAGINHLTNLTVDGDITLVGSGILLIDEIQMGEGSEFLLQTNTSIYEDGTGSVAVFLLQEDGTYLLINGDVPGILDEEYHVEGVTLVIPDDATLVLQSVAVVKYTSPEGESAVSYSTVSENEAIAALPEGAVTNSGSDISVNGQLQYGSTAPNLVIEETAKLIIDGTATLIMNSIIRRYSGSLVTPMMDVAGELQLDGSVVGGITVLSGENALSGEGSFLDATLNIQADQTAGEDEEPVVISASDSTVDLSNGTEADVLALSGDSVLRYDGSAEVGELVLDGDSANVELRSEEIAEDCSGDSLTLDTVDGNGTLIYQSGNVDIGEFAADSDIVECDCTIGLVTNEEDGTTVVAGPNGSSVTINNDGSGQDNGDSHTIFFLGIEVVENRRVDGSIVDYIGGSGEDCYELQFQSDMQISGEMLKSLLPAGGIEQWIEIYYIDEQNNLQVMKLDETALSSIGLIPAASISLIRSVGYTATVDGSGGGTDTTTSTAFTGTGVLGNGGAGNVIGGTGTAITIPRPDPNPDPDPDPDPDPNPDPDPDPDPNPDPKPTIETAAAQGIVVWAEPEVDSQGVYVLRAGVNGRELSTLVGRREVRMNYKPADRTSTNNLYVVFRNSDGTLTAVKARYDATAGKLIFTTGRLGRFVVVSMDYDGVEFSGGFYKALEKLDEVKKLG